MSKGFASNYRIVLLASGILLSFVGLGARLVCLHVVDRAELMKFVTRARRQIIIEHARRGDILDATGSLLASSHTQIVLGADPQSLRKEDEPKWPELARLLGLPLADLQKILTTKLRKIESPEAAPGPATVDFTAALNAARMENPPAGTPAPAATVVQAEVPRSPAELQLLVNFKAAAGNSRGEQVATDADEAVLADEPDASGHRLIRWAKLSDHVDEGTYDMINALGLKGIYGTRVYRRAYPHDQLAAHLIGYVSKSGVPMAGVESYADFYLRGQNGWREGERDGRGREMPQFRTREVPPNDGCSVTLSINTVVQHLVEEELDSIVRKFSPEKATIIVSEAQTGFILALGNYPSFNLNEYGRADLAAQRNIAETDQLDPGSTFKIVAASGALNDGLVQPGTRFDCTLVSIDYKGRQRRFMPDEHHYDHLLTVGEIISHSSNIGAAQLGMKLGEQRLYDYARAFGFGTRTGFPFGGEISGVLNPPEKWNEMDITRIPAGYSISATPLQIHYAMGVIASGGLLLRPQIIREVRDASGEFLPPFDASSKRLVMPSKRRVITQQTAEIMARMLMGVASPGGTAPEAAIPNFQVAGKTGTAQKLINGHYSSLNHIGSFVGFFPATRPELVISIIVDDGKVSGGGSAYGRVVAAPSFRHLGEQLIQYRDIKPVGPPAPVTNRRLLAMEGVRR